MTRNTGFSGEKKAVVTGPAKFGDKFEQQTEVTFDGKTGQFPVDDHVFNDVDPDKKYLITFDDGSELPIRITGAKPSELEPSVVTFAPW